MTEAEAPKDWDELLDPKWRGKIVGGDPRTKGSGFTPTTMMRVVTGSDDIVKKLWVDQEVMIGTDARQLAEFMVRGRFPIGIGAIERPILADFPDLLTLPLGEGWGEGLASPRRTHIHRR